MDNIKENKVDACVVTETWLKEHDNIWISNSEFKKNNYIIKVANRNKRQGGGLALICRSCYRVKECGKGINQTFEYAIWQLYPNISLTILAIYHPPYSNINKSTNGQFIDEFAEFLVDFLTEYSNVIIMGDFNIRLDNTEDPDVTAFIDTMSALGLDQHVSFSTHKNGGILDHIYTETLSKYKVLQCYESFQPSDHIAVECVISVSNENITTKDITYRRLHKINTDELIMDIANLDDGNVTEDLDQMVTTLENNLSNLLEKHAPEVTKTVTIKPNRPWYSKQVEIQKRIVRRHEKLWQKYKQNHLWAALQIEREKYKNLLTATKTETLNNKVLECKQDTKKLYKLVHHLTSMKADNSLPKHDNEENLANEFADYFMGKIKKIRQELNTNSKYTPSNNNIPILAEFTEVTQDEVQKIIMNLATKNCELDPFPTSILKEVLSALLPSITTIMNTSLKLGVFVKKWKVAVIHPLLKKAGLELIPKNYRPVSNLSFLSKVLEQCVLMRFNEHCDNHSLLPDYQSAYRPNYSCKTSLLKIINDMLWAMERKSVTAMVVMDLNAVFDTVDHDILLSVLENKFGIKDVALKWFESYPRPRSCKVSINSAYSAEIQLPFNVPQGSCAGPSLFLAYASTLQELKSIAECKPGAPAIVLNGFEDDHSVKKEFHPAIDKQEIDCIADLEHCMGEVQIWMDQNCLKLNNVKTELILFGSQQTVKMYYKQH